MATGFMLWLLLNNIEPDCKRRGVFVAPIKDWSKQSNIPDGNYVTYTYDSLNQLVSEHYSTTVGDGSPVPHNTISYSYDPRGNILSKTYSLDNAVVDTITYTYTDTVWADRLILLQLTLLHTIWLRHIIIENTILQKEKAFANGLREKALKNNTKKVWEC